DAVATDGRWTGAIAETQAATPPVFLPIALFVSGYLIVAAQRCIARALRRAAEAARALHIPIAGLAGIQHAVAAGRFRRAGGVDATPIGTRVVVAGIALLARLQRRVPADCWLAGAVAEAPTRARGISGAVALLAGLERLVAADRHRGLARAIRAARTRARAAHR